MPITDQFERLPVDLIIIPPDRQRTEIETADLEGSIRARGVLQPIVVRTQPDASQIIPVLVAGHRRLEASKRIGLPDIPVRWAEDLSEAESQIIELEENIKRQDLSWKDLVRAVQRIHNLYLTLDPAWTMTETSQAIGLSLGATSMYIRVASELGQGQERVDASTSVREAYNVLMRREARAQGDALEELLGVPMFEPSEGSPEGQDRQSDHIPNGSTSDYSVNGTIRSAPQPAPGPDLSPIKNLSFLDWAPSYSGPKFNLIHCDFPYGNEAVGPQLSGSDPKGFYKNDRELYLALLESLCNNLNSLLSLSGHLMFWCSSEILSARSQYAQDTWQRFHDLAPSLEFHRFPLIWVKSDSSGIAADPRRQPRHVYETCLLASRGARQIVKIVADAYSSPSDHRLHPSTKPEPMLRHFMAMLVDDSTSVLDPTAGSGAALRAADSLGARRCLGLEIDPDHCKVANQEFRARRLLRGASLHSAELPGEGAVVAK